jgi:FHA domain
VIRHRLRFLMQEFDLAPGITLLGRSSECHITLEDALVSRTHARIERLADVVTICDESSRNGIRVNGQLAKGSVVLSHGDRIRIGTQELVFTRIETTERTGKTTGFLRHCIACKLPYPEEAGACTSCGATGWVDEDTLTAHRMDQGAWQLKLYVEVLERALGGRRFDDVERIWNRANAEVEERFRTDMPVESEQLLGFALVTLQLSVAVKNVTWACCALRFFKRGRVLPTEAVAAQLPAVLELFPLEITETLREVASHLERMTLDPIQTQTQTSLTAFDWSLRLRRLANDGPENAPSDEPP